MKKNQVFNAFLIVVFCNSVFNAWSQPQKTWSMIIGDPDKEIVRLTNIVADQHGNIFVGYGSSNKFPNADTSSSSQIKICKYDENGKQLWLKQYKSVDNSFVIANGMAIDKLNNIIVVGEISKMESRASLMILKYDENGNLLYDKIIDKKQSQTDESEPQIAVDKNNDVYIASKIGGRKQLEPPTGRLMKCDQNGKLLWDKYDMFFLAGKIVVDNNTDVLFCDKYIHKTSDGIGYKIKKISSSGTELWQHIYETQLPSDIFSLGLLTDSANDVYVIGSSSLSTEENTSCFTTIKYSKDGKLIWRKQSRESESTDISMPFSKFDKDGNILVVGKCYHPDNRYGLVVQRLDKDGKIILEMRKQKEHYESAGNGAIIKSEKMVSLSEDADGRIYTISQLDTPDGHGPKNICRVSQYDKSGNFLWKDDVVEHRLRINAHWYYKLLFSKNNLICVRNDNLLGDERRYEIKYTITNYVLK